MLITDLCDDFLAHPFDEQAYLASHPVVFEDYALKFQTNDQWANISEEQLGHNRALVVQCIDELRNNPEWNELTDGVEVVLFIGRGDSNGHACLNGDQGVAYLALEHYTTLPYCQTFVTHELTHAIHYQHCKDLFSRTWEDHNLCSRLLITEGLATLATCKFAGLSSKEALFADYFTDHQIEDMLQTWLASEPELLRFAMDAFHEPLKKGELFWHHSQSEAPLYSRAGYWLGMRAIENIGEGLTLRELFSLPQTTFEKLLLQSLQSRYDNIT